jgi:hypothetical protein
LLAIGAAARFVRGVANCHRGPRQTSGEGISMGTRTTYVCDCCFRESDNNLGWAHLHINGASGGKQLMPDDDRDLCEICWSPMHTLMKKVHDEAQERRNSGEA